MKKVELPNNTGGERSHRVACLATTCDGEVWGGCRSGFVFCYHNAQEEQEDEREERAKKKGGELVFSHKTQLCGKGEGMTGVNAIVGDKGGLVWVGAENGWLSVWKSVDGAIAAEEVKFRVPLLHQSVKKSIITVFTNQSSFMELEFGVVSWEGLSSSFLMRGEPEEEGMVLLRDVMEVREIKGKLGGLGFVLVDKGGKEREFEFENRNGEGQKALDLLKFGLFCVGEKRVLKRVGQQDLKGRVVALEMAGGRVWSFDDTLKVFHFVSCFLFCLFGCFVIVFCFVLFCFVFCCSLINLSHSINLQIREWKATHDLTGQQTGTYQLDSLRSLDFTSLNLSFDLSQNPFSCFFPVGNKELYVVFKQFGVILERSPFILEEEREGGRLELKRVWNIFREKIGGERQREDVWCGVYFGLRKEVWLGTSEGWVWRKGNKLEKKRVEGGVRVMAVVGSQVFFFFFHFFFIFFLFFFFEC